MIIDGINITPLLKASKQFESFRQNLDTEGCKQSLDSEQMQLGAAHAFVCCYELSWKTMQKLLAIRGKVVNSPRETFRAAALERFITDPEVWFDFTKKRNLTEYLYEKDVLQEMISILPSFSEELQKFIAQANKQFPPQ